MYLTMQLKDAEMLAIMVHENIKLGDIEAAIEGKSSRDRFWSSQCREILMASFRCYHNSNVFVTLIIKNFHLYLIQLW